MTKKKMSTIIPSIDYVITTMLGELHPLYPQVKEWEATTVLELSKRASLIHCPEV
jgi:hypothetical protein